MANRKQNGKPGEFKRTCPECGKEFTTDNARQKYDERSCGNSFRSRRWFQKASKALKQVGGSA